MLRCGSGEARPGGRGGSLLWCSMCHVGTKVSVHPPGLKLPEPAFDYLHHKIITSLMWFPAQINKHTPKLFLDTVSGSHRPETISPIGIFCVAIFCMAYFVC